ncbi:hypothetical protein ACFX2I_025925 [Malus domestica]
MILGIAAMMLQCVIEVSLSIQDMEIENRPYHRNCSCALHNLKGICSCPPKTIVSFPKKQPCCSRWLISTEQRRPERAVSCHGQDLESLSQQSNKEKTGVAKCHLQAKSSPDKGNLLAFPSTRVQLAREENRPTGGSRTPPTLSYPGPSRPSKP